MGSQPIGQGREVPQLAQVNSQLKQAMLMQRQGGASACMWQSRVGFHRVVVGDEGDQTAVGDPLFQALVAPIEGGATFIKHRTIGLFVHAQQHLAKTGVQTHHIAFFHHHFVFGHDVHQHVVAHHRAGVAHMSV